MNWLNKLERKFGRFAIPNLIMWLIGAYAIGFVLNMINPGAMSMLSFQPHYIFQGQIWRIFTWIFQTSESNLFFLFIMMMFYYQLGMALERNWGTFRFNAYIFGGILFTIIGGLVLYGILFLVTGPTNAYVASTMMGSYVSTYYINMSIFLAFATLFPNMEIRLYFFIPIKMKWMAWVYAAILVFDVFETWRWVYSIAGEAVAILVTLIKVVVLVMSLLNFLIFFLTSRNVQRYSPKEVHRRQEFKRQMREPRPGSNITRHKCAVCGRTEVTNPELEFRFCSKCEGNYEYCQDHLFTHQHIRKI